MQTVVLKCHNFGFQADTELLGASAAASNRKRSSSSVPNDVPSPAQGSQLEEDCSSSPKDPKDPIIRYLGLG